MTVRTPILNTDTDSAETFRLAMGGLFLPASALNARTGVLTTPVLTGTGALTATVSPFNCIIDGTSNSLQGSYSVAVDLASTVTITSGNTQARIDLICLQIQDNDYDGSGFHRGQFVVVAGVPSGSPAVPATPANAIALWTLPVPALASTITFSTATAVFPYTAAAGGIPGVRNAADKPLAPGPVGYRHRLDVGAGGVSPLEYTTDNGTTYTPVSDPANGFGAWTALTLAGNWTTFVVALQYRTAPGGKFELRGALQATATVSSSTSIWTGFPAISGGGQRYLPWTLITANTNGYIQIASGTATLNIAVPPTIPSGSIIVFDGVSFPS